MQDKSVQDIQRLAEGGDTNAQYCLGYYYAEGFRVKVDADKAVHWYQLAGQAGYLAAYNTLGQIYQREIILPRDNNQARKYFKLGSDAGYLPAKVNLGRLQRLEGNPQGAVVLFQQAADAGSYGAMTELYESYWNGVGVTVDEDRAFKWLMKAADGGDSRAQCVLGYHYYKTIVRFVDVDGERQLAAANIPEAVRWFTLSASQGWPGGQYYLATLVLEGKGIEVNEERALDLMRQAADQGHFLSLITLASFYQSGIGEPRSEEDLPIRLLSRAAKYGASDAYAPLAYRYRVGLGVDRDFIESARWHVKATQARRDYRPGINSDEAASPEAQSDPFYQALKLYLRAGKLDEPEALAEIAGHYLTGDLVPKDATKAWLWSSLARQKNAANAATQVAAAEKEMTAEELEKTKELLPEFVADLSKMVPMLRMETQARSGR